MPTSQRYWSRRSICDARELSDRTFNRLRAQGVIPPPIYVGPRTLRWTDSQVAEILQRIEELSPANALIAESLARVARGEVAANGRADQGSEKVAARIAEPADAGHRKRSRPAQSPGSDPGRPRE